jgi:hypothetical protein
MSILWTYFDPNCPYYGHYCLKMSIVWTFMCTYYGLLMTPNCPYYGHLLSYYTPTGHIKFTGSKHPARIQPTPMQSIGFLLLVLTARRIFLPNRRRLLCRLRLDLLVDARGLSLGHESRSLAAGELATASFASAGGVARSFFSAGGTGDGSGSSASGSGRG